MRTVAPIDGSEAHVFLVERYWPGATVDVVRSSVDALLATPPPSPTARHLSSTLLPEDDCVLCVFLAATSEEVAAWNERAGVPYDRLVPAVQFTRS